MEYAVDYFDPGCSGQLLQLLHGFVDEIDGPSGVPDKKRPCNPVNSPSGNSLAEVFLCKGDEIEWFLSYSGDVLKGLDCPSRAVGWKKIAHVCFARKAVPGHLYDDDEIQPDQEKICEILSIQTGRFKMGVDKTQTTKVPGAEAVLCKVRDKNTAPVADENVVYDTPAVDKEPQLPSGFTG